MLCFLHVPPDFEIYWEVIRYGCSKITENRGRTWIFDTTCLNVLLKFLGSVYSWVHFLVGRTNLNLRAGWGAFQRELSLTHSCVQQHKEQIMSHWRTYRFSCPQNQRESFTNWTYSVCLKLIAELPAVSRCRRCHSNDTVGLNRKLHATFILQSRALLCV